MRIPVVRGKIGDWIYYTGVLSFEQISQAVTASINDLYKASCLDELLQRALTDNFESIRDYILKDHERFFNGIILAIYNGDPQWLEVEFAEEENAYTNVGFLQFSGDETIFPVDGQHRVAGICAALSERPQLASEQVPAIFIAHRNDAAGIKRTRKLFSTLNRRAKPVGQNENIALDEDDVCAIITRELVQEVPLCMGDNIVNNLGKQIPKTNETAITSLITLYQCVEVIVKHHLAAQGIKGKKYSEYKLYRPKDEDIQSIKSHVFSIFDAFVGQTDAIKEYLGEENIATKARRFRNSNGGNLLFRPIALTEYFEAALTIVERDEVENFETVFSKLNCVEMNIAKKPWIGLIWDGEKMINRVSKKLIRNLLVYMARSDLLSATEKKSLVQDYARSVNCDPTEAKQLIISVKR